MKKSLFSLRVGALTGPVILGSDLTGTTGAVGSTFGDVKLCFLGSFLNPFNKDILEVFGEFEIFGGVAKAVLDCTRLVAGGPKW